jgi:hypothetical protein
MYAGGRVRVRDLVKRLDRDNVQPLKRTKAIVAGVPTDFREAETWIHEQPGATLDLAELQRMPGGKVLHAYLDPAALARVLDGGDGAHRTMVAKVLHAVYAAQEGRAGLVVALHNIGEAYLRVMESRESGEMVGDVRDPATATVEWAKRSPQRGRESPWAGAAEPGRMGEARVW